MTSLKLSKRKGSISPEIRSRKRVRIPSFRQTIILVLTEQEKLVFVFSRPYTGKNRECGAARKVQEINCKVFFCVITSNSTRDKINLQE